MHGHRCSDARRQESGKCAARLFSFCGQRRAQLDARAAGHQHRHQATRFRHGDCRVSGGGRVGFVRRGWHRTSMAEAARGGTRRRTRRGIELRCVGERHRAARCEHRRRGRSAGGTALARSARRGGVGEVVSRHRTSARAGARQDGTCRHRSRPRTNRRARARPSRTQHRARGRSAPARRARIQREFDPATRQDPLRREGTLGRQAHEIKEEPEHRRGDAGEDPRRVARVHRRLAVVPRDGEAARNLRRGFARHHRRRRTHPCEFQPDRRAHRPLVERPAESAQHSGAHRRGSRIP